MRIFLFVLFVCTLGACTSLPDADNASYRDRETTTGSNIPRRGQAVVVDKQQFQDSINRSGNIKSGG